MWIRWEQLLEVSNFILRKEKQVGNRSRYIYVVLEKKTLYGQRKVGANPKVRIFANNLLSIQNKDDILRDKQGSAAG
jgi:hypothetical protein